MDNWSALVDVLKIVNRMELWGAYDKFLDFLRMRTFIDSTRMKL